MQTVHFHPEPHTSWLVRGTKCDGCECLHVIKYKRLRLPRERYWCDALHESVDPFKAKCPRGREKR